MAKTTILTKKRRLYKVERISTTTQSAATKPLVMKLANDQFNTMLITSLLLSTVNIVILIHGIFPKSASATLSTLHAYPKVVITPNPLNIGLHSKYCTKTRIEFHLICVNCEDCLFLVFYNFFLFRENVLKKDCAVFHIETAVYSNCLAPIMVEFKHQRFFLMAHCAQIERVQTIGINQHLKCIVP